MIETFVTILSILGVGVVSACVWLYKRMKQVRKAAVTRAQKNLEKSRRTSMKIGAHLDLLTFYYKNHVVNTGLVPFNFTFRDRDWTTGVFGRADELRMVIPLPARVRESVNFGQHRIFETTDVENDPSPAQLSHYLNGLRSRDIVVDDNPLYRLQNYDILGGSWTWDFTLDQYGRWHYWMGPLAEELFGALHKSKGDVCSVVDSGSKLLCQRSMRLNALAIAHPSQRFCAGGPAITCAFWDGQAYQIPIRRRAPKLAAGAGMIGVVPQGMHQHRIDSKKEASLVCTLWREFFEELFDGKDVAGDDPHLDPLWFIDVHPGMNWFTKNENGFSLLFTGLGFDALAGTYDPTFLLIVDDPDFLNMFRSQMCTNWEYRLERTRPPFVETNHAEEIESLLVARDWTGSSLYSFARALAVLARHRPESLPGEWMSL